MTIKDYILFVVFVVCLGTTVSSQLKAAATATQQIPFSVSSITALSISGTPSGLNITSATPGSLPISVQDSSTSYSLTTNISSAKITGSIDSKMPTGTTLAIKLNAPTTGTSAGSINLTTTAQDLVTAITPVAQSALGITYTFSVDLTVTPIPLSATRTLTLTLQ